MPKKTYLILFLGLVLLTSLLAFRTSGQDQPDLLVVCSPEKPTAFPDERVALRAWASSRENETLDYTWSVSAGSIQGSGPEVQWDLSGVTPGAYRATVIVRYPSGQEAKSSLEVLVLETAHRGRATGWAFLLKGRKEKSGYGLHSYLLLGSRPTEANRERYGKAIEAYLEVAESIASLEEAGIAPHQLNVTYFPVIQFPPVPRGKRPSRDWLLENYDYAGARALLMLLPGEYRAQGPYILSSLRPLRGVEKLSGEFLYQDLSTCPPQIVGQYARDFFSQAAQERFWEENTMKLLCRNLRKTLAVMAHVTPTAIQAVIQVISLPKV